jgi:hypothetical protein
MIKAYKAFFYDKTPHFLVYGEDPPVHDQSGEKKQSRGPSLDSEQSNKVITASELRRMYRNYLSKSIDLTGSPKNRRRNKLKKLLSKDNPQSLENKT